MYFEPSFISGEFFFVLLYFHIFCIWYIPSLEAHFPSRSKLVVGWIVQEKIEEARFHSSPSLKTYLLTSLECRLEWRWLPQSELHQRIKTPFWNINEKEYTLNGTHKRLIDVKCLFGYLTNLGIVKAWGHWKSFFQWRSVILKIALFNGILQNEWF